MRRNGRNFGLGHLAFINFQRLESLSSPCYGRSSWPNGLLSINKELLSRSRGETDSLHLPSRHYVAMVTMMMPLSTGRNGVLRPERTIQEMSAGERRTSHSRYGCDARAEGRCIRTASPHAEREHTIEHCRPSSINETDLFVFSLINAQVATNALAVVWHTRCESASGGLTPSSVRRYRNTIDGWHGPKRNTA